MLRGEVYAADGRARQPPRPDFRQFGYQLCCVPRVCAQAIRRLSGAGDSGIRRCSTPEKVAAEPLFRYVAPDLVLLNPSLLGAYVLVRDAFARVG